MYSCNDCNGWDDTASTVCCASPSQIVRCCNNYTQNNCDVGNFQNSHRINVGNRTFLCKEVKDNTFDGNGGGCCLGGNENLPCDLVKESALSRRKRYTARLAGTPCMPPTMPVTEYQEAYQKCYRSYKRQGPGTVKTNLKPIYCRPPWNSSITVPAQPFEESLEAAEAKLRLLDLFGEDCPMDMMLMEIKRDRVTEAYRQARNPYYGGGGGARREFPAKNRYAGAGGGGESQAFMERQQQTCKEPVTPVVLLGKPSSRRHLNKKCQRKEKPTVYMNGSQLELVEDESVLSHDADEVLNDMWKKLDLDDGKFQCHLKQRKE